MTVPITCYNCPQSGKTMVGKVPGFNREIYVCKHPIRDRIAWPEIRMDSAPPENCPRWAEQLAAPAPAPTPEPTCATCRFYMVRPGINATDGSKCTDCGICRRRAPVSGENFPSVGGDFWCGEHEAKT